MVTYESFKAGLGCLCKSKTKLLTLTIAFSILNARGENIRGQIVSEIDGEPLEYALVKTLKSHRGCLTDSLGMFAIKAAKHDTLYVCYTGFEDKWMPNECLSEDPVVRLMPRVLNLQEVMVRPKGKPKQKTFGKKHKSGLLLQTYEMDAGCTIGVSVDNKASTWLTGLGFYQECPKEIKDSTIFVVNIYDTSAAQGPRTRDFKSILVQPITFVYEAEKIKDGKFEYDLEEPILLPEKSYVEAYSTSKAKAVIWFKGNLLGKSDWYRDIDEIEWSKTPFSQPMFVKCEVYKR